MIQEIVKRMALSHFHVKFNFNHNHRTIFSLPRAESELQQEQRFSKLFGKGFLQHAFKMDFCAGEMRLWGWLTTSNYHRAQQDQQYFYINKRTVRDKLIHHAIRQVYHDKLPANRHAAYILFLEINPEMVDVNVHPTKHEVRFRQARFVHDFIVHALKQSFTQSVDYLLVDAPQDDKIKENVATYENCNLIQHKYPLLKPLKMLFSKYLLLDHDQTVLIIDCRLALQNFLSAIMQKKISKEKILVKPLLIPMRINIGLDKISVINLCTRQFLKPNQSF